MTTQDPRGHEPGAPEHQHAAPSDGEGGTAVEPISRKRLIALVAGPLAVVAVLVAPAPDGMSPQAWRLVALATGFSNTGLAEWIGKQVSGLEVGTWMMVLMVLVAIVYLAEITSNTATTATFLPILGAVAAGLGIDPQMLTVPVALAASMAFMMPVATPPNAIVFSYQDLHLGDMVKAGFWLNILAIGVGFGAMYLLAGLVFGVSA